MSTRSRRSRRPSTSHRRGRRAVSVLVERLAAHGVPDDVIAAREAWAERCRDWRARYPVIEPRHRDLPDRVSTYVLAEALSARLSATDTMVIGSSGAAIETFMLAYSAPLGQRAFLTGGLGAMGFGLPAAIGASLGANRGRTVLVDGDGGFQLNIQEAGDARRLGLPVKVFVLDNRATRHSREPAPTLRGRLVGADAPAVSRSRTSSRSQRHTDCGLPVCRAMPTCLAFSARFWQAMTR